MTNWSDDPKIFERSRLSGEDTRRSGFESQCSHWKRLEFWD